MPTSAERLLQFYALVDQRRFAELDAFLGVDVTYIQLNTMSETHAPRGAAAVIAAYADWYRQYVGMRITELLTAQLDDRVLHGVNGAVEGFRVCYTLAYNRRARDVSDIVWLDSRQRIIYLTSLSLIRHSYQSGK